MPYKQMGRRLQKSNMRLCTEIEELCIRSVVEPELKFNCFSEPEPKLWIAAPAPFYLPHTFNPVILVKKGDFFTKLSGAVARAEIRICGSVEPEQK
jgi:hypothetical protein